MRALAVCVLVLAAQLCVAASSPLFQSPEMRARYQSLTKELRCVICLNQSIASSTAPLARQMRDLVAERMRAGDTDAQIKDILVERYGTFVLYDPPFRPGTWLLWLGPAGLLLIGVLLGGALIVRGRRQRDEPLAVDQQRLQQVLQDTEHREQKS